MGKYFTIKELSASSTAQKNRIENIPTPEIEKNLNALIENVLDPTREYYGKAIYVNSGYRCPELNKLVKGALTSQHLKGEAADIDTRSIENNKKIFEYIKDNLDFDQLIWEKGGEWVHVSFKRNGQNRKQVLNIN